ncbi:MAG: hypothetical protein QMB33_01650, partial [Opitutales bacterium]
SQSEALLHQATPEKRTCCVAGGSELPLTAPGHPSTMQYLPTVNGDYDLDSQAVAFSIRYRF